MNNFIELLEYNVWANRRIVSQVMDLAHEDFVKDAGAFNSDSLISMRQAVLHLLKADWIWLDLWRGKAISDYPDVWDQFTMDDIEKVWSLIQANILEELKSTLPAKSEREIEFSNGDETIHILKFYQTINLVINHATYYRGQIANMIDTIGVPPVKTDLFDYYTRRIHL